MACLNLHISRWLLNNVMGSILRNWAEAVIVPLKFTDGCENILDDTVEIIQKMNSDCSQDVKYLLWKSLSSKQLNRQLNANHSRRKTYKKGTVQNPPECYNWENRDDQPLCELLQLAKDKFKLHYWVNLLLRAGQWQWEKKLCHVV